MKVLQKFINNNRYALCFTILLVLLAMLFINYNNNLETFYEQDDDDFQQCVSNYAGSNPHASVIEANEFCGNT